jgi:hypothetical protein
MAQELTHQEVRFALISPIGMLRRRERYTPATLASEASSFRLRGFAWFCSSAGFYETLAWISNRAARPVRGASRSSAATAIAMDHAIRRFSLFRTDA